MSVTFRLSSSAYYLVQEFSKCLRLYSVLPHPTTFRQAHEVVDPPGYGVYIDVIFII